MPIIRILVLLFCLSFLIMPSSAQEIDTIFSAGALDTDIEQPRAFTKDMNGNFYVVFQVQKAVINFFGTIINKPIGYGTIYTIYGKLDSAMNVLWVKTMDVSYNIGIGLSTTNQLVIDDAGNIYYSDRWSKQLFKFSSIGDIIWIKEFNAQNLFFDKNGHLEFHQFHSKNDSINGQPITNKEGTVAFFDTSGSYISHFTIDDPTYAFEMISGRSHDGYYGYRKKTKNSTAIEIHEIFICDTLGNIIKSGPINCSAAYINFNIVYDSIYQNYYISGSFRETDPLTIIDMTSYFPNNQYVMQMNGDLQITGTLKLNSYNLTSNVGGFYMHMLNGSLYLTFLTSFKYYTHLGIQNHLNFSNDNQLVMAKVDHTLNVKWYKIQKYVDMFSRLTSIYHTNDGLYYAGTTNRIDYKGITFIPYDIRDVVILKVKDHDSTSAYLKGKVYYDKNKNGIDDNEDGVPLVKIANDQSAGITFTTNDGSFEVGADTGTNILKMLRIPKYWARSTPDSIITYVNNNDTILHGFRFGIYPIAGIRDASVIINSLTAARPGFPVSYKLTFENKANDTLQGVIHLVQDSSLVLLNASIAPDSINGPNVYWNYSSLQPGETREIIINDSLKNNINLISETLINLVSISPFYPDTVPQNNYDTLYHNVTGSYDPNDISVKPGCLDWHFVNNDEFLEYTIRFQNTGTDTAFSVILRDTLPDRLRLSTFEIIDASHDNYDINIQGNLLFVHFKNILLPHEAKDYIGSHGYFKYKAKVDPIVSPGEIISNKAYIYFDFNPPIITNNIITQYPFPVDTVQFEACKNFISPSGKYSWNISGNYIDTLPSFNGCDSIVAISLSINHFVHDSLTVTACESYISPGKNKIWNTSGTYVDTIQSTIGCDSIILIDLTINKIDTTIDISSNALSSNEFGGYYQWVDCTKNYEWILGEQNKTFYPTESGNYAVIIKKNDCTDTSACFAYTSTLISRIESIQVQISPNPTIGKISIDLGESYDDISVKVFNSIGQLINTQDFESAALIDVQIKGAAGFYIIELRIGTDAKARYKVMKE